MSKQGRPRITTASTDYMDRRLTLIVAMPDGCQAVHEFVLPDGVAQPGEYQLTGYSVKGRACDEQAHLRHIILCISRDGQDYLAAYDVNDMSRFERQLLPHFTSDRQPAL